MQKKIWLLLLLLPLYGFGQSKAEPIQLAQNQFRNANYESAIQTLRGILLDSEMDYLQGDAYFWLGKIYLTLEDYSQAEKNLEYFLSNFRLNGNYSEGLYQKGRLLFFQKEFDKAISILDFFLSQYPDSPLISNAHFWLGECFYETGNWDKALTAYNTVIKEYPQSFKLEAAKYRLNLISLKRREEELLLLIRWSHEEELRTIEEFQRREVDYKKAINEYQEKLALLQSRDLEGEVIRLTEQLNSLNQQTLSLQNKVDRVEKENKALLGQLNSSENNVQELYIQSDTEVETLKSLVNLKERVLNLKDFYYVQLVKEGVQFNGEK